VTKRDRVGGSKMAISGDVFMQWPQAVLLREDVGRMLRWSHIIRLLLERNQLGEVLRISTKEGSSGVQVQII